MHINSAFKFKQNITGHARDDRKKNCWNNRTIIISEKNFFWSTSKDDTRTYDKIRKIKNGQWDDYITGCLIDCICFKSFLRQ